VHSCVRALHLFATRVSLNQTPTTQLRGELHNTTHSACDFVTVGGSKSTSTGSRGDSSGGGGRPGTARTAEGSDGASTSAGAPGGDDDGTGLGVGHGDDLRPHVRLSQFGTPVNA
jgi:hypothetical protein